MNNEQMQGTNATVNQCFELNLSLGTDQMIKLHCKVFCSNTKNRNSPLYFNFTYPF